MRSIRSHVDLTSSCDRISIISPGNLGPKLLLWIEHVLYCAIPFLFDSSVISMEHNLQTWWFEDVDVWLFYEIVIWNPIAIFRFVLSASFTQNQPADIARTPGQKGEVMGNLVISPWQLVVDKHLLDSWGGPDVVGRQQG